MTHPGSAPRDLRLGLSPPKSSQSNDVGEKRGVWHLKLWAPRSPLTLRDWVIWTIWLTPLCFSFFLFRMSMNSIRVVIWWPGGCTDFPQIPRIGLHSIFISFLKIFLHCPAIPKPTQNCFCSFMFSAWRLLHLQPLTQITSKALPNEHSGFGSWQQLRLWSQAATY